MASAQEIAALYRSHFPAFVRFAYRELHPGQPLVDAWHIDVVAEHLERVAKGEITRLIINLPPRSLKSLSASIALPVWMLGRDPRLKIMSVAGSRDLARDFETASRSLIASQRCRALFPYLRMEDRKGDILLPHGGRRVSAVVGGTLVGRGADVIIIDDPIAPAHVHDDRKRRAVNTWFDAEVIQRLNDKARGAIIVVMQRLHHNDLCGHLLGGEQPWVHLKLPAIATTDETWHVRSGRVMRRPKEPLAPAIESFDQLYDRMLDIGAYNFGAQYQQTPFVYMNDGEVRGGCFAGPDDCWGFPGRWLGTISERRIMAYEVFGLGDLHPAAPPRRLDLKEFARLNENALAHSRSQEDDE